jgi:hypothetical protein
MLFLAVLFRTLYVRLLILDKKGLSLKGKVHIPFLKDVSVILFASNNTFLAKTSFNCVIAVIFVA